MTTLLGFSLNRTAIHYILPKKAFKTKIIDFTVFLYDFKLISTFKIEFDLVSIQFNFVK